MPDQPQQPESHTFFGSSMVSEAQWNPQRQEVEVVFQKGGRVTYGSVTQQEWESFKGAPSAGKFLYANLKGREI